MSEGTATTETRMLVRELLTSIARTVDELLALDDAALDHTCSHGCAMGGGVRRLLVHNAEHDRQHAGAVSAARQRARAMQESELGWLLRDWLRERAELAGQLLAAPDAVLDARGEGDEWTVREHIEHVLFYERESVGVAIAEAGAAPGADGATG